MSVNLHTTEQQRKVLSLIALAILVLVPIVPAGVSAVTVGTQEFFIPLPANLSSAIWSDIFTKTGQAWPSQSMTYVVGMVATVDNTTVYYDHWENGYAAGAAGDLVFTLNRGQTQVYRNDVPTSGSGTYYNGGDRIFVVGGPLQVVVSTWGSSTGTVLADAWEVYPLQAWENSYVIPVGPNLANNPPDYNDFETVWIQVMSATAGNAVQVRSRTGALLGSTTLGKGGAYNLKLTGDPGSYVSSSAPVQVQLICGNRAVNVDMRGYSVMPRSDWGNSYYAPAPSWSNADTDLYVFNPSSSAITITYEDRLGSGSFTVGANSTRSYQDGAGRYVPTNSGVHLYSGNVFRAIAACDTESSTWDWAYSLVPEKFLTTETYLSWAPGDNNNPPSNDGSSVFVTGTAANTTVWFYNSAGTLIGTRTIDRLQTTAFYDPDHDSSGLHIVASSPVAVAWGEDPSRAGTGNPYLDMGYTCLPIPEEWQDVVMSVNKTATPAELEIGDVTTFTVTVSNPSPATPVTYLQLIDTLPVGWDYVAGSAVINGTEMAPTITDLATGDILTWAGNWTLDPGRSLIATYQARATSAANPTVLNRNVATARGTALGQTLIADDDAFIQILQKSIHVEKSVSSDNATWYDADDPPGMDIPQGQTVYFRVNGTNNGNVIWTVNLSDTVFGVLAPVPAVVAPGGTFAAYWSAPAVLGQHTNIVNATGTNSTFAISASDTDPANYFGSAASINLTKSGPATAVIGENVTYTFNVTNPGNVPLANVTLSDPLLGGAIPGPASGDDGDGVLEPGEVWRYSANYTVPAGAPNPLANTATVNGDYLGQSVNDSDSWTVPLNIAPAINLTKTGPSTATIGETVTYIFTVTNTGNVPLSNVTVVDPLPGLSALSGPSGDDGDSVLELTETWMYTATYTVPVGAPNPLTNTATVTGDYVGQSVDDTDGWSIPLNIAPAINLTKTGPSTAAIGETITYTFTVTNTGNVPLSNVSVVDPLPGLSVITGPSGDDGDSVLELTETWTYTATYTVPVGAPNPLTNTATATGDYVGQSVDDTDDWSVPLNILPAINLTKTGPATATVGETITYTFTVTNPGNVPLSNVTVTDLLPGLSTIAGPTGDDGDSVLELTETWTYTATYTVPVGAPNPLINAATATGDYQGQTVNDTDDWTVPLNIAPAINLTKTGASTAAIGETVTYTFTVTNTGNVPLSNVTVTDPLPGLSVITGPSGDDGDNVLELTEIWTFTATYTVPVGAANPLTNTATATGDYVGQSVDDTDDWSVPLNIAPAINLTKTGPSTAAIGETVTYIFTVTNTGNVPLSNVSVADPLPGLSVIIGPSGDDGDSVLELTETWTYTATYVAPVGAPNPLTNTAIATGDYVGQSVDDSDSWSIPLNIAPAINLTKTGPSTAAIGETITYTFTVTNTGNVPLANVVVSDPLLGGTIAGPGAGDDGDGILELTETWTYTETYTVPVGAANPLTNTATATGDYLGQAVSDSDSWSVPLNIAPALNLTKTGPSTAAIGETVTYTFTVTNTGNVPLSNVSVADPLPGLSVITGPSGDDGDDVLEVTETWTYTATYTVPVGAPNPLTNTATATGDYVGQSVDDTDDWTVPLNIAPAINLTKTGPSTAAIGETVTYTFTVTNTGNVPLSNVTVVDPLPGLSTITGPSGDDGDSVLELSETWTYTATYTVPAGAPNPLTNTATATGDYVGQAVSDSDSWSVPLNIAPAINLTKTGPTTATVGETITYTFTVTNPGNVPLSNVTVTDPLPGLSIINGPSGDDGDSVLELTETWTYTATYTVPVGAPNPLINAATATGDYQGQTVNDTDDWTVPLNIAPAINLTKTGASTAAIGETVTYTFTVTNTGNVPLANVVVSDPLPGLGTITGPTGDDGDHVLDLTETWTYTATYVVPAGAPNPLTNTATATGDYVDQSVSDTDDWSVPLNIAPAINLTKTGPATATVGETITYTFKVTNTGNVPLSNVTVTDPLPGLSVISGPSGDDGDTVLELTETWTYTATYTVPVGGPNPLTNTATVTGDYVGQSVNDSDNWNVPLNIAPAINLTKTGPSTATIGETVTYIFTVTNTGNVPLSNVTVVDPLPGLSALSGPSGDDGDSVLELTETWMYTATYTVPVGAPNPLTNTATVTGDYVGQSVDDTDDWSVPLNTAPAINLTKTGPATATVGETVTYTFTVTNTGNVPLSNVIVTDPLPGLNTIMGPSGDDGDNVLELTEIWTYTATYVVPAGAPNPLTNTATATGDYVGQSVNDSDSWSVPLNIAPAINLTKTGPTSATVGETVTYTFTVRNTGNVPLSNVTVVDSLPGLSTITGPAGDDGDSVLELTETWTYTATYTVPVGAPNPLINAATATGDYQGQTVTDTDDWTVPLNIAPAINLTKTGPATATVGETITYTFTVTNPGNVPLSNVTVTDPLPGLSVLSGPSGDDGDNVLELTETWTYTATYVVPVGAPNPLTNTATATGDYVGQSVDDTDDWSVLLNIAPAINLTKTGPSTAAIGETVTYTFTVTNTGNVPLTNVVVTDPLLGGTIAGPGAGDDGDGILELTETWTYTETYTVPVGAANPLTNTATATGDYIGQSVNDADSWSVLLNIAPAINLTKTGPTFATVGETITYTFTVTNTGNVPLSNVTVSDPLPGLSTLSGPAGDDGDSVLELTETWTYTATYTVAIGAPNPLTNSATATGDYAGTDPVQDRVEDSDEWNVPLDLAPAINLTKTGPSTATVGETITYTFTVTNTGNVPLSNVTVTDPLPDLGAITGPSGDIGNDGILGLTETWVYTATYTLRPGGPAESITNTATVTGDYPGTDPVEDSDDWTVVPPSVTGTPTATHTATPTMTQTVTQTVTSTASPTVTETVTQTATATVTQTETTTVTQTVTQTATSTATPTATKTVTQTTTPTVTPTVTQTATQTASPTATKTVTQSATPTATATATQTVTQTTTQTATQTATSTATATATGTATPNVTQTATQTATPTATATVTVTATPTATPTVTPTATPTVTGTATPTATATVTGTTTAPVTATPTATPTPTPFPSTIPSTEATIPATSQATPTATRTAPPTTVRTTAPVTVVPTPTVTIPIDTCPAFAVPSGPVTTITGPSVITEPGFYRLGSDVRDTTAPVWLDIRASGVVVDGMGHTIDGIDADGSVGIRVRGDGALAKIVIQNLTVTDFAYGITLYDVDSGQIIYVQAASNTYDGIMVVGGSGIEIHCSLVDRDDDGINISATRGAVVANNVVTGNVRGSGVHLSHGCDGVTVLGNLIGENDEGIEVESTTNSVIRSNRIHASRYYGLNLTTARDLTVVDNHFNNSVNIRYPTGAFSGTWNLEAQPGPNVLGNSFVGGNYWGTPDGTGFSDTTPDLDGDGFVNGMYVLGAIGTDRLPLGPPLSAARGAVVAPPVAHGSAVPFAGSDSDPAGSPGAGTPAAPDMAATTGAAGAGVVTTVAQATDTPPTATTLAGTGAAGQAAAATAATVPGFGAVVALAGLGGATLVALRRR